MGKIRTIRSGGQTGADRGALEAARQLGVPLTGWCPLGGLAEDYPNPPGLLLPFPELVETTTKNYYQRTALNVRDSDATLILLLKTVTKSPGTTFTIEAAQRYKRPCLVLDQVDVPKAITWLDSLGNDLDLNVAGSRERFCPGVRDMTHTLVSGLLKHYLPCLAQGRIVLASGSPRRLDILRAHGIEPLVILPQIVEDLPTVSSTADLEQAVRSLALAKAQDVYQRIHQDSLPTGRISFIIAADTVVFKERVLGKPDDKPEAIAMLEFLRNSDHQVFTGVALIEASTGAEQTLCDISTVTFGDYTRSDIEDFIDAEQPFDKAGSYALQGVWGANIKNVAGDRENVIGLPWHRIASLLSPETTASEVEPNPSV
ncbi:MAG: Maf family nucleotide pyrophosphatase [Coriobacteriia bacterium]|nr:Maf family nucleotide pyrophosphatase [Coriobacteriia bacterium]